MGIGTTNINGARVHKSHVSEYKEAKALNSQINQLREQIANDPNISPKERKALLAQLDKADNASDRAIDHTTTSKRSGRRDDKFDKNDRVIDNNIDNAERMLYEAMGNYTDARGAASVDKPTPMLAQQPVLGAAINPDIQLIKPELNLATPVTSPAMQQVIDSSAAEVNGASTTPKLPSGEAFSVASNPNVSASDIAKNIQSGSLNLSGSDLRALAASDPKKFQEIMSELSKLPGGEETAMRLNQDMQNSLQKMNRMFSLLSNITQALHDTQKALINNIRV
jgi:hypothetical protein